MLNIKLLNQSFLAFSFLGCVSSAEAMFGKDGFIDEEKKEASLSVPLLKKGYNLWKTGQYLESNDGKKYKVTNIGTSPDFFIPDSINNSSCKTTGKPVWEGSPDLPGFSPFIYGFHFEYPDPYCRNALILSVYVSRIE